MKKLFTLLTMLALIITGAKAIGHVPQTGQHYLDETSLKAGVAAAAGDYLVALQIHAGSTFYINNQGKAQSSFAATGETTWIVEKTSDDKYLLKTFSGKYIKTLGGSKSTAATFTTNSNEALKFNPVQSTSTDGNMESGYVANKAIWWNVDGGSNRINTNGISGTSNTIFQNDGTGCWTCLFTYEVMAGYNCYTGDTNITEEKWKTQGNWALNDNWNNYGPGCSVSGSTQGMWSPIYLKDITSGTVPALEGWNFRMIADHSTFTINQVKKIQSDCYLTLKNTSVVTMNFGDGQQNPFTVNLDEGTGNILNFVMTSSNFGSQITLNYGDVTKNSNRKFNASASSSRTINRLIFSAALTEPTEANTVESIHLAEFANNVTITNKTFNISGTGWTEVGSEAELSTQFINGKYYYVENTTTGVKLHTYKETTKIGYTVAENSTETLSQIDNYENYDSYTVPSNSTLIIDIDDFNLKRIYGTGNIGITSGKTLVVSTAGFDLTRITGEGNVTLNHDASLADGKHTNATGTLTVNEGVKLSMGSGQTTNASVKSFSNVVLMGTLHFNTQKNELNNLTVPENKTGVIFSYDMNTSDYKFELKGTTTINTGAKLITCNRWKFKSEITKLAGSGVWEICGTTGSNYAYDHQSKERSLNTVLDATTFTGTINLNNVPSDNHPSTHISTVTVEGNLVGCTLKKTTGDYFYYSGANLNGTTLEGVILNGSARINTSNTVNIKNLAGNNLSNTTFNYALVGTGTLNLEGDCDFTKKSDNSDCDCANIGYRSGSRIVIRSGANVKAANIYYDTSDNAAIIVEGTLAATKLHGPVTLAEGSVTTLSEATPFNEGAVTVSGNATLNLSAANITLNQPITIASGKTLTIDGASTAAITLNSIDRSMAGYTFTNCTSVVVQFTETGAEYAAGGFTITDIPDGITIKVKKYGATDYETVIPVDGTATISHSVEVSGSAAWLDYTFDETTLPTNQPATPITNVPNRGNAGSGQTLTIDNSQTSAVSYNSDGTFKVRYTPYRSMTWPENYTVAVSGNFPDVENGCLVAFGTKSANYLALIRGANSNEIKLVKGNGNNTYTNIQTMAAENATAAAHLVVFTKQGNVFKVYCDGVNVATTEYDQTLGGGLQVGSIHGGYANTGVVSVMDNSLTDDQKNAVFCNAIRVYNYIISDDQMTALMKEFPYVSNGGSYSRTISADANLGEDGAWTTGETTAHIPTPVVEDASTYYPDVTLTTSANATLTVNENATFGKTTFGGSGTLTIAANEGHSLNIGGAVIINSDVVVKFGAMDMSTSPVTKGADANLTFDFSAYDFSSVNTPTNYPVTGNTADYGSKVTGVYPIDQTHTYTLAHNSTSNNYILTVAPTVAFFRQRAINLVKPYYDGNYVGVGAGKYTISLGETSYAEMSDFETAVMRWESLEEYVEPTIAINQPTSAFYRIKSGDKYLQDARKSDSATQRTLTDAAGANSAETIFYLDNNKFIGYKTGYGFGFSVCQTQDTEQLNTQLFTESAEMGKYTIQSQQGTCTSANYNEGYWGVSGSELSRVDDAASGACWTLEEVTSLPLTLAANSYTSFSAPVAVTIPDGCHAYVATSTPGDSYITMTEVTGNVPANQGLIIGTDATANPTFTVYNGSDFANCDGNMLVANVAASYVDKANNYFFGKVDGNENYVFAKISGSGTRPLGGHKAYLHYEKGTNARMAIIWEGDDPTGIEGLQNESIEMKDGKYYQNGKVVVVRNGVKYNVAGQIIK